LGQSFRLRSDVQMTFDLSTSPAKTGLLWYKWQHQEVDYLIFRCTR